MNWEKNPDWRLKKLYFLVLIAFLEASPSTGRETMKQCASRAIQTLHSALDDVDEAVKEIGEEDFVVEDEDWQVAHSAIGFLNSTFAALGGEAATPFLVSGLRSP